MFDFDAGKLLVIGIVALIVIGPKDLPRVLRQLGQMVAKLRRMANEFQSQFMEAVREAELEDIRSDMTKLGEQAKIKSTFNPLQTVRNELTQALADKPAGAPALGLKGLEAEANIENSTIPNFAESGVAPVAEPALEPHPAAEPPPSESPESPAPAEISADRKISGL